MQGNAKTAFHFCCDFHQKPALMGGGPFPGGPELETLPANAEDTGSIPGAGGSRVPRGREASVPQLLGLQEEA